MITRENIGRLGVWCATEGLPAPEAAALVQRVESMGYSTVWLPEVAGRDPFAHIAYLATEATKIHFATGIANIYHRLPGPMVQAANTLAEQTGGRFMLGMGVSHQPMVEGLRGQSYAKPLSAMRTYLETMDASPFMAAGPTEPPPRLLAALGPNMLALAAQKADGVHPYWTTPEHTKQSREIVGPDKLVCVEQKVVLSTDADVARATANTALSIYATLPNYRNTWLRLGFTEQQIESRDPAFLDAVVAWGDADAIKERLQQHWDAGADQVCVQALSPTNPFLPDEDALSALV